MKRDKNLDSCNIAIVGHRPDKLWGYRVFGESQREIIGPYNYLYDEIRKQLKKVILENSMKVISVISGMDIGVQQLGILAAINIIRDKTIEPRIRHMIKTVAMLPCAFCETRWPNDVRKVYYEIMQKIDFVNESKLIFDNIGETAYRIRDEKIINSSDIVIAVYNNVENSRTLHALRYASIKGKRIIRIDPNKVKSKSEKEFKVMVNSLPELVF